MIWMMTVKMIKPVMRQTVKTTHVQLENSNVTLVTASRRSSSVMETGIAMTCLMSWVVHPGMMVPIVLPTNMSATIIFVSAQRIFATKLMIVVMEVMKRQSSATISAVIK